MASKTKAKLPLKQLVILAICRFAEPITLTSVFPYIYFMIQSFGIEKDKIGLWAGIVSATFSISQVFTAIWWGRLSDRIGRKPVILLGLLGTMISALTFGFSTNLTMAIIARCCLGALNGNIGIIRSVVAELVGDNKELQSTAFCLMPLVWSFGSIIGPVLGGVLSQPALKYPDAFPPGSLLDRYPYALPNIVSVAFLIFGLIFGALFLEETLETRKHARDPGLILGNKISVLFTCKKSRKQKEFEDDERTSLLNGHSDVNGYSTAIKHSDDEENYIRHRKPIVPHKPPTMREVFTPQSTYNIIVYFQLALHNVGYDQLLPVFMSTDPADTSRYPFHFPFSFSGGLGKSSSQVGTFFSVYGIICMVLQFVVFPPVTRRLGTLTVLKGAQSFYPFIYFLTPLILFLPRGWLQDAGIIAFMFAKGLCIIFSFPASTIMLTNSANGTRVLGTLNGVATTAAAIGRAMGPTFTGFMFSQGQRIKWGYPPWIVLSVVSLLGLIPIGWLVEQNFSVHGRTDENGQDIIPTIAVDDEEEGEEEEDEEELEEERRHRGELNASIEVQTPYAPLSPDECRALERRRESGLPPVTEPLDLNANGRKSGGHTNTSS